MTIINNPARGSWEQLLARPVFDAGQLQSVVGTVIERVRTGGDTALKALTSEYDGVTIEHLAVTPEEFAAAESLLDDSLKAAIQVAHQNIYRFHIAQKTREDRIETMPGVWCWRRSVAIDRVGLYIPGGNAPLFSTVLMLAVPAKIAGSREIVLCTPPQKDGQVHPAVLFAASVAGISHVYKTGGAQAIAAMAYGTETIPSVYKIFGPGNQYVNCAKAMVQQAVAIDMPAGPSEVCVLADETANPSFVAADLLSQAEHGADSQVLLVTTSAELAAKVIAEVNTQLETLGRKGFATAALEKSRAIVLDNIEEAMDLVNQYAAEHLIIAMDQFEFLADRVLNAGSVFLGHYSPESVGDYASGTNHTLPTNAAARAYSGVSVDSFVKKITYQQLTREGLKNIGRTVEVMARAEGLDAHANAVTIRLNELK
ncbi:MAG: histidinol dehydrogenase [Chitinophagaceae bacterium]|nr:MAG: histidinol dehydrogenase [Chitinophagaceae bacterium]